MLNNSAIKVIRKSVSNEIFWDYIIDYFNIIWFFFYTWKKYMTKDTIRATIFIKYNTYWYIIRYTLGEKWICTCEYTFNVLKRIFFCSYLTKVSTQTPFKLITTTFPWSLIPVLYNILSLVKSVTALITEISPSPVFLLYHFIQYVEIIRHLLVVRYFVYSTP